MSLSFDKKAFEKVIIFNVLKDAQYLETVIDYLKPSFFTNEKYKSLYQDVHNFYLEYKKVPSLSELKIHITEPDKRKNFKEVIESILKFDNSYDKDVLLKLSEKFLKEKTILQVVQKTSVDAQSGDVDSSKILKDFENACSISLFDDYGFDYLESIDRHCLDLQKTFETISTGWSWLDEKLGGGFQKDGKAVYMFFGATNVGKSIFLGNIATNVLKQNKTVVLITLEMPETVYSKRVSAQLSNIPFAELKDHIDPLKSHLNEFRLKNSDAKLIIKEFPPKSVTPLHIKNYVRKLIRKGVTPDLIVLDYLTLLSSTSKSNNSYEPNKDIAEQVRALSYEFDCSIVTAAQMNRSGYNQADPDLDTTGESMGIAHTVDCQISIWTEDGDIDLGIIHMGIVKNRFGPRKCSTVLEIDYPTLSLKDPDDVSKSYITPMKDKKPLNIHEKNGESIVSTLDMIQNLGEDG